MIRLDHAAFRYEPWPFAVAGEVFSPDFYDELSLSFPPPSLLKPDPGGKRLSLRDGPRFEHFFKTNRAWGELQRYTGSRDFLVSFLALLSGRGIDIGSVDSPASVGQRMVRFGRALRRRSFAGAMAAFRVELVLVVLPADGGELPPHTDAPTKAANIVLSMARPGEWDPALGGSTDLIWPKDPRDIFSVGINRLAFEDVHVLDRVAYAPNQAVIVVKTYNSWHSVGPMRAPGSRALRKTLNINILHN